MTRLWPGETYRRYLLRYQRYLHREQRDLLRYQRDLLRYQRYLLCGHRNLTSVLCIAGLTLAKPKCPPVKPGTVGICVEACSGSNDCSAGKLCCFNGCGHTCRPGNIMFVFFLQCYTLLLITKSLSYSHHYQYLPITIYSASQHWLPL